MSAAEMRMMTHLFKSKSRRKVSHMKVSHMSQFDFLAPNARQVSLAGNFNNWDPEAGPMQKGPDGVWRLNVDLNPGRHEYRFVADGLWCDDPAARQRTANSLGTENCVRIV